MDEERTEFKCEICNEASFDALQKLSVHQVTCRRKHKRDERVPFGAPTVKWNVRKEKGYHYRVFNDNWYKEPGRIERAKASGYEPVDDPQSGITVGTNEDGSEIKGIVMRIPSQFHEEDDALKQAEVDKVDEQIYGGKFDPNLTNTYGGVKIKTQTG